MSVFALNLGGTSDALGAALNGINNVNVGDIASQAAMGVLVGAMVSGIKGQLAGVLPGLAPAAPAAASPSGGPTATAAALGAMSPQAQAAFFAAGGHVIG